MKFGLVILIAYLVSSCLAIPSEGALSLEPHRDVNFIGNTRELVLELIQNLREAAKKALEAVKQFSLGLQEQSKLFFDKVAEDIQKARERVRNVIKNTSDRFANAGSAVRNCIDSHMKEVDNLFNDTVVKSKQCASDRIDDINIMIENLKELTNNATEFASASAAQFKECTETEQGILSTGTCLGVMAVRTELKGAIFLTRSGLLISRINLAFVTLPATLDICAGTKLVEAGINSAKIVMEVGTCSATSIYSSLTGSNNTSL